MATNAQIPAAGPDLNGRILTALRNSGRQVEVVGTGGVLRSTERIAAKSAAYRAARILGHGYNVRFLPTSHGLLAEIVR